MMKKTSQRQKVFSVWLFVLSPNNSISNLISNLGWFVGDLPSFEQLENPKSNLATNYFF